MFETLTRAEAHHTAALDDAAAKLRELCGSGAFARCLDAINKLAALSSETSDGEPVPGIDLQDESGETALTIAVSRGFGAIVSQLLQRGADGQHCAASEPVPLVRAAAAGHADCVEALLGHYHDILQYIMESKYESGPLEGHTSLSIAASRGHADVVRMLLCEPVKADVHGGPYHGAALLGAVEGGHTATVKLLLEEGCDANSHRVSGEPSALEVALQGGHWQVCAVLLSYGADVHQLMTDEHVRGVLVAAIELQLNDAVDSLITHAKAIGVVLDASISNNRSLISSAVRKHNVDALRSLLNAGASANFTPGQEASPLALAASMGWAQGLRLLLDHGANPKQVTEEGSPLQIAVLRWYASVDEGTKHGLEAPPVDEGWRQRVLALSQAPSAASSSHSDVKSFLELHICDDDGGADAPHGKPGSSDGRAHSPLNSPAMSCSTSPRRDPAVSAVCHARLETRDYDDMENVPLSPGARGMHADASGAARKQNWFEWLCRAPWLRCCLSEGPSARAASRSGGAAQDVPLTQIPATPQGSDAHSVTMPKNPLYKRSISLENDARPDFTNVDETSRSLLSDNATYQHELSSLNDRTDRQTHGAQDCISATASASGALTATAVNVSDIELDLNAKKDSDVVIPDMWSRDFDESTTAVDTAAAAAAAAAAVEMEAADGDGNNDDAADRYWMSAMGDEEEMEEAVTVASHFISCGSPRAGESTSMPDAAAVTWSPRPSGARATERQTALINSRQTAEASASGSGRDGSSSTRSPSAAFRRDTFESSASGGSCKGRISARRLLERGSRASVASAIAASERGTNLAVVIDHMNENEDDWDEVYWERFASAPDGLAARLTGSYKGSALSQDTVDTSQELHSTERGGADANAGLCLEDMFSDADEEAVDKDAWMENAREGLQFKLLGDMSYIACIRALLERTEGADEELGEPMLQCLRACDVTSGTARRPLKSCLKALPSVPGSTP